MCRPFLLFLVYFKSYICSVYLDMVYQGELSNILTKMYNAKLINTAINSFPVLKCTFKTLETYVNHYFLWWDIINTFILFSWPYVVRFRVWFSFFFGCPMNGETHSLHIPRVWVSFYYGCSFDSYMSMSLYVLHIHFVYFKDNSLLPPTSLTIAQCYNNTPKTTHLLVCLNILPNYSGKSALKLY